MQYVQGQVVAGQTQLIDGGQQVVYQDGGDYGGYGQPVIIQGGPPGGPQYVLADEAPGAPQVIQQQQIIQQGGQVIQQGQIIQQDQGGQGLPPVVHVPLAKARCLYLGSAVPTETALGLEALQQPLRERYHTGTDEVAGIDAWLTVYSSGIRVQYVSQDTSEQCTVWFAIQNLHVCAAVKAIDLILTNNEKQTKFVALDSEHGKKSNHPPIFSAIMRRSTGRKILECHVFVVKSNQAAMALVQSTTHAYEHKEGWRDDEPQDPEEGPDQNNDGRGDKMRLLAAEPKRAAPEFYKPPPKQGYYYTPNKGMVKNYNIHGSQEQAGPPGPGYGPMPVGPPSFGPAFVGPAIGPPIPYEPYGPPPMAYFDDWGAFESPVSIFGAPPPEMYGPEFYAPPLCLPAPGPAPYGPPAHDCKKKKKQCRNHGNSLEYYPDHQYKEYRDKHCHHKKRGCNDRGNDRDHGCKSDRRVTEYREPTRERVYIEREPAGRDRYYDDPYRSAAYGYEEDLQLYAPRYMEGDMFYDGYGGGGRGGGGRYGDYLDGGYGDLADRFRALPYY